MLGIVEMMQYFLVPLVLESGTGEPGRATLFDNLYLYKNFLHLPADVVRATLA